MAWWHYLLLVNIYLTLFFGFYALLLRRETFFQLNRIYLVGAALLSFFIPLMQSEWVKSLFITQKVQYVFYGTGTEINITDLAPIKDSAYTIGEILVMVYLAGVTLLALRLMWQFIQLRRVIKQETPSATPYSFFNTVNVPEDTESRDIVMAHEHVHAREWHSADVLIVEAVMIINWFNPVVYFYRFAVKHIHEYIADRQAIDAGNDKAEYAMLLLSQTFNTPQSQLVNPFYNHSLLKQRIMMLQKNRSARVKLLKYGLSAPLFGLMLVLSSATISNSKAIEAIHDNAEELLLQPATGAAPEEAKVIQPTAKNLLFKEEAVVIDTPRKGQVFAMVDQMPQFPGDADAFARYVGKYTRYPAIAREANVQGRVILTFIVEKTGALSDVKVLRGIGSGCDEEAVRVIKASPRWIPGKQKGKKVRVQFSVPVSFSLATEEGPGSTTGKQAGEKVPGVVGMISQPIFTAVEQQPAYPGGNEAMAKYLQANLKYPAEARKNNIQGRVITSFVVFNTGSIGDVKVLHGIGHGADEEAVRVVKAMPKWNPGMQNGRPVNVQYTIPITFSLSGKQLNLQGKVDPAIAPKTSTFSTGDTTTIKTGDGKTFISLNGPVQPLYMLNGKEISNLGAVNPKDIDKIEVLKDASATAIYGEKAKNGVVLITTKKAK